MTLPVDKISRRHAIALLWHQGVLTWKLEPVQKALYESYHTVNVKTIVWTCSRRIGKSYALCVLAIEKCIVKPNSVVKYIAPTQKHVKMILKPLMKQLLNDCPKELRPQFITADNTYRFPNGSEIQMAGTDSGRAESLRGGSADICIVDEAGFCSDLKYIVQSILIPTTTTTRGKIILSSTPPVSPDHEFASHYVPIAQYKNAIVKKTIYDAIGPRITEEIIKEIVDELGGADSLDFRREYMCEMLKNEDFSVVPEANDSLLADITQDPPAPPFRDFYVAGDIGFKDLTVFLFGYYDFRQAKIVIMDELVMNGKRMTTSFMAEKLKEKERECFTNPITNEQIPPYLRVCDNNLIVINDLYTLHGLTFQPTSKDDKEAAINNMRIMLKEERIIISSKCKTLLFHLKNATWNKSRKAYMRSPDAGHYDAVDALIYFVRNVQQTKNPYPANWGLGSSGNWWTPNKATVQLTPALRVIKDIFNPKKRN